MRFISHSQQRNASSSRDRLLEEQNAAYLDSVRADREKVRSNLPISHSSFLFTRRPNNVNEQKLNGAE